MSTPIEQFKDALKGFLLTPNDNTTPVLLTSGANAVFDEACQQLKEKSQECGADDYMPQIAENLKAILPDLTIDFEDSLALYSYMESLSSKNSTEPQKKTLEVLVSFLSEENIPSLDKSINTIEENIEKYIAELKEEANIYQLQTPKIGIILNSAYQQLHKIMEEYKKERRVGKIEDYPAFNKKIQEISRWAQKEIGKQAHQTKVLENVKIAATYLFVFYFIYLLYAAVRVAAKKQDGILKSPPQQEAINQTTSKLRRTAFFTTKAPSDADTPIKSPGHVAPHPGRKLQ